MIIDNIHKCDIHLIPSFACNLDCSHCDVKHKVKQYKFDEEKFFSMFEQLPKDNKFILFGGEPLLNDKKILHKIFNSNKINSMTTNLLLLDDKILDILIEKNVTLGTSWNPDRFTNEQHKQWLNKIKLVKSKNKYIEVFITLTDLLFKNIPKFIEVLDELDEIKVDTLTLSMVIPSNKKLVNRADNLFCWLEDNWRWKFRNRIKESLLKSKQTKRNGCINRSLTLYPDGKLDLNCTHTDSKMSFIEFDECKQCVFYDICGKCPRQPVCVFYKQYYMKLAKNSMRQQLFKTK